MDNEKDYKPPTDIRMPPLPVEDPVEEKIIEEVAGASAAVDAQPSDDAPVKQEKPVELTVKEPNELEKAKASVLREKAKRADQFERERDEAIRRLQEAERRQYAAPTSNAPTLAPDDTDVSLGADDLAEGKHLNKLQKKIKEMEQRLESFQHQSIAVSAEQRVKMEMPDYADVVNDENIELLKTMAPELAESISYNPDLYSKAKSAYKLIKKFGIHVEDTFKNDRAIVEKNMAKPRPLTSVSPQQGASPLSKANAFAQGLTPELADQLRREMYDAASKL